MFYVDALHSFKVMLRTKKGQTDGWRDRQTDGRTSQSLYATLRGIKIQKQPVILVNVKEVK